MRTGQAFNHSGGKGGHHGPADEGLDDAKELTVDLGAEIEERSQQKRRERIEDALDRTKARHEQHEKGAGELEFPVALHP
jgi:hypothetical protein